MNSLPRNALIRSILTANALILSILTAGAASAAVPLEKSGPCPNLERQAVDPAEDWGQFPVQPTAEFNPGRTIQKPLSAAQSINCMEPAAGLKAQLWASEEMTGNMKYIQHFDFDERGRLWAVEPVSYPNTIRPASGNINDQKFQGGKDRIVILEDTDGDHVMDKFTVFREGLNLPQSIACVNGGVVVTMTPYVVYFPNDGSDKAGTPIILFSGMGESGTMWDTHGGINQIMYGLDNWIYGHCGYNNCSAQGTGANGVECGHGSVWRFRHKSIPGMTETRFETWSSGPSNADGLGQMEDGQLFQSGATLSSHMNHAAVQGASAIDIRTTNRSVSGYNPTNVFYPITGDRYLWEGSNAKDEHGWITSTSTATSGVQFYTGRLFPKKYWNRFVFACEGASKLCNQDSLVPSGSTWKAFRLPGPQNSNLLASKDAWTAPLLAKSGPDGAVWVLDWNNYLFLHNPAGPAGPGSAWISSLRTKNTNRIYRILPTDAAPDPVLNLANATEDQLIAALSNHNFFWRLTAQRLLIAKGVTPTVVDKLKAILTTDKSMDEVENSPTVQHALWTLEGLGQFTKDPTTWIPILKDLLKHPAWCVRRNVLRVMPRTAEGGAAINDACSVNDPHAHVRLQALLAFGKISSKPANLQPIQSSFANVDRTSTAAQQGSGVPIGDPSCKVTLEPVSTSSHPIASAPRQGLRFQLQAEGFRLLPHGELPNGILSVYDLQGRLAFTSSYNAVKAAWSVPEAHGLTQPVYGYTFRGADGLSRQGSLALLGAR